MVTQYRGLNKVSRNIGIQKYQFGLECSVVYIGIISYIVW